MHEKHENNFFVVSYYLCVSVRSAKFYECCDQIFAVEIGNISSLSDCVDRCNGSFDEKQSAQVSVMSLEKENAELKLNINELEKRLKELEKTEHHEILEK